MYRIFEAGSDKPLEIFGIVLEFNNRKKAIEAEEDIAYSLLNSTVEVENLETWEVDEAGKKIRSVN